MWTAGLTNGTLYYYVVAATNVAGEGPNSAPASAMPGLPAPPTGLQATALNGEVDLQWNAVPTATSYNVKRATTNGGSLLPRHQRGRQPGFCRWQRGQ